MQISITYQETQEFIAKRTGKQISLAYVDPSTVKVSYAVNVFGLSKSIGLDLKVTGVKGTDLFLSYSGSLGIDLLVGPFLVFVKRLMPEKTGFVKEDKPHAVKVCLGDLEPLEKVFEKVTLHTIDFDPQAIVVHFALK